MVFQNKIKSTTPSVRRRYLLAAVLIASLLLLCAISAQIYVDKVSNESSLNIDAHKKVLKQVYHIQSALARSDNIISDHLLSAKLSSVNKWKIEFSVALNYLNQLEATWWSRTFDIQPELDKLRHEMSKLRYNSKSLLYTRLNIDKQFPALYYARSTMLPLHRTYMSAARNALEELSTSTNEQKTVRMKILQARWIWLRIVTNFRMYLINRLTSIAEESLVTQAKDIETFYAELVRLLTDLKSINDKKELDIETSIAINKMINTSTAWHRDFQLVKIINASANWRTDRIIRIGKIQPGYINISKYLQAIIEKIDSSSSYDLSTLSKTANGIIVALWTLTFFGLLIILLAYKYFDSAILKPIQLVTEALHAEASGDHSYEMPSVEFRETQNMVTAFSFMRNQIQVRQSLLEHQALHDRLTSLPNRYLLESKLDECISQGHENAQLGLMILDLNRFKDINDSLGHHIGDHVLDQAGNRVKEILRETDTIARWGGDEFAILLIDSDQEHSVIVAEKITEAISKVMNVDQNSLYIGASIGIANYPQHALDAESLLKCADMAMYIAKRNNNSYFVYNSSLHEKSDSHIRIIDGLSEAINSDQLELALQPISNIKTKKIVGVDTLIRWQHDTHGLVSAYDIITIAEHHGLVQLLMQWVLDKALAAYLEITLSAEQSINTISVNISIHNLKDSRFIEILQLTLEKYNFDPTKLMLDIPEEAIMSDSRLVLDNLFAASSLGIKLAIDHYGTGNSSLSIIKRLPISTIKIDKSFVSTMMTDDNNAIIVRSTINLAHNLGLNVVSVGIETHDLWDLVEILGSDYAQGFIISDPMPPINFKNWLSNQSSTKTTPEILYEPLPTI